MEELILKKAFITLGQLLQVLDLADSGAQAKEMVKQTVITVNGEAENRRGRKLYARDIVEIGDRIIQIKA